MMQRKNKAICLLAACAALLTFTAVGSAQPMFENGFCDPNLILNGGAPLAAFPVPPAPNGYPNGATCIRGVGVVENLRVENIADGCSTDGCGLVANATATGYAIMGIFMDGNYPVNGGFAMTDNDVFDLSLRIDGPTELGTASGFWIRLYSASWNGSAWVFSGGRNFFFNVPVNAGWQCFCRKLSDWNENNWLGTFDPNHIYLMRIDSVVWGANQVPYTFGIDHLKMRPSEAPVVTCPDDINIPGGCANHVVLTATSNPPVDAYEWKLNGQVVSLELTYDGYLEPGNYNFTFTAYDSTKPCDVATCDTVVTITAPSVSVDAGPPQTYYLDECQVLSVEMQGSGSATIDEWIWKDALGNELGYGPTPTIKFLPGVYNLTLFVKDYDTCAEGSDTTTVTITAPFGGLPVQLPLGQQINPDPSLDPNFDAIRSSDSVGVSFETEGSLAFTRGWINGSSFYFGPMIKLPNACFAPIDLANTYIRFTARFYQQDYPGRDPAVYTDAPIGIRFWNANGTDFSALGVGNPSTNPPTGPGLTFFHGPAIPSGQEYQWKVCGGPVTLVDVRNDIFGRTAGFDPTQVTGIEFVGSDWGGLGDYIDIYDLYLGTDPLGACCTAGETCTPLLTEAECDALSGVSFHPGEACGELSDSYDVAGASLALEDISGTGTLLVGCDDCGYVVPLGFTFSFFGQDITEIGVASNGYLSTQAGNLGSSGNGPIPGSGAPNSLIAPLWYDWNPASVGNVYYQTLGSAPNRRFVALWKEVAFYGTSTPTSTFEAILYEGTNKIEFRYGAVDPKSGTPGYGTAYSIGVENETATIGVAVPAETIGSGGAAAGQVFTTASIDTRVCAAAVLGDMNCSGAVTVDDIAPFIDALLGQYNVPGCDVNLADMNADTFINGLDIQGFVDALIP